MAAAVSRRFDTRQLQLAGRVMPANKQASPAHQCERKREVLDQWLHCLCLRRILADRCAQALAFGIPLHARLA